MIERLGCVWKHGASRWPEQQHETVVCWPLSCGKTKESMTRLDGGSLFLSKACKHVLLPASRYYYCALLVELQHDFLTLLPTIDKPLKSVQQERIRSYHFMHRRMRLSEHRRQITPCPTGPRTLVLHVPCSVNQLCRT